MKKSFIRAALLLGLLFLFSMSTIAQSREICKVCLGTGRIPCTRCFGETFTSRDKDGLAIFCTKCACNYCNKRNVGTNQCLKCSGEGFLEDKSEQKEESILGQVFETIGTGATIYTAASVLEKFKENYEREKNRISTFEYEKERKATQKAREAKERLKRQQEYKRRQELEIERNKKQYNAEDILKWGKGYITSDFTKWLNIIQLPKQKDKTGKKGLFKYVNYQSSTILLNLSEADPKFQEFDLRITPVSQIKMRIKFVTLIGLMTKGYQKQVEEHGRSAIYISAFKEKDAIKNHKYIPSTYLNLTARKYDTLFSAYDRKKLDTGEYNNFERFFILDSPATFDDNVGDVYIIEMFICSKKDNNDFPFLQQKKPFATLRAEIVSPETYRKWDLICKDSYKFETISGLDQPKLYWKKIE